MVVSISNRPWSLNELEKVQSKKNSTWRRGREKKQINFDVFLKFVCVYLCFIFEH